VSDDLLSALAPPPAEVERPIGLPIPRDRWHSRWLVFPRSWTALHRVATIEWEGGEDMIAGTGATVCGRRGRMIMPGFMSRLGLPRCAHCCRRLGIPAGNGAPFNSLEGEAQDA